MLFRWWWWWWLRKGTYSLMSHRRISAYYCWGKPTNFFPCLQYALQHTAVTLWYSLIECRWSVHVRNVEQRVLIGSTCKAQIMKKDYWNFVKKKNTYQQCQVQEQYKEQWKNFEWQVQCWTDVKYDVPFKLKGSVKILISQHNKTLNVHP
jgi:hypothetical protein